MSSSQERLVRELKIVADDDHRARVIVAAAERGEYDDRLTPHPFPKVLLVEDLRAIGREELAQRVIAGEFDTTREEWRPPIPPLTPEEIEHYKWLIDGLLQGVELLTGKPSARKAVALARTLIDELMARLPDGEETR